jgi:hypothetical protein
MGISWRGTVIGSAAMLLCTSVGCASAMGGKRPGEPCTRTEQCSPGLVCSGGACREHNAHPQHAGQGAPALDEDAGASEMSQLSIRK